jgi:hypothetical protein
VDRYGSEENEFLVVEEEGEGGEEEDKDNSEQNVDVTPYDIRNHCYQDNCARNQEIVQFESGRSRFCLGLYHEKGHVLGHKIQNVSG